MAINDIKNRVYYLLEQFPETRNSDALLVGRYWWQYENEHVFESPDGKSAVRLTDLSKLTSFDSISRCRRKIQNEENRFWPTDEKIAKARNINMDNWKEWALQRNDTL